MGRRTNKANVLLFSSCWSERSRSDHKREADEAARGGKRGGDVGKVGWMLHRLESGMQLYGAVVVSVVVSGGSDPTM